MSRTRHLWPMVAAGVVALAAADAVRRGLGPRGQLPVPPQDTAAATATVAAPVAAPTRAAPDTAGTYLSEMLVELDSVLRRWPDDRRARPLRVAVISEVDGVSMEGPTAAVVWATGRWDGVVPVGLVTDADTGSADILVSWRAQLDSGRSGRTDVTWNQHGEIGRAVVTLAMRTPAGRAIDRSGMSALALHELGHALGLGHSPHQEDVMYPVATALALTDRDLRTIRALYAAPPGRIR